MIEKIQNSVSFGKLKRIKKRSQTGAALNEFIERSGLKNEVEYGLSILNERSGKHKVKFTNTPYVTAFGCYEFQVLDKNNLPLTKRETFSIKDSRKKTIETFQRMCATMEKNLANSILK